MQDGRDKKGRFATGNPGRPKGSKNRKTKAWEELGKYMVEEGTERVREVLRNCNNDEFLKHFKDLLQYFKPQLQRQQQNITSESIQAPDLSHLSFDQLLELVHQANQDEDKDSD